MLCQNFELRKYVGLWWIVVYRCNRESGITYINIFPRVYIGIYSHQNRVSVIDIHSVKRKHAKHMSGLVNRKHLKFLKTSLKV